MQYPASSRCGAADELAFHSEGTRSASAVFADPHIAAPLPRRL
jgi:hypothetical protein